MPEAARGTDCPPPRSTLYLARWNRYPTGRDQNEKKQRATRPLFASGFIDPHRRLRRLDLGANAPGGTHGRSGRTLAVTPAIRSRPSASVGVSGPSAPATMSAPAPACEHDPPYAARGGRSGDPAPSSARTGIRHHHFREKEPATAKPATSPSNLRPAAVATGRPDRADRIASRPTWRAGEDSEKRQGELTHRRSRHQNGQALR
jgi:hypothetical protein